MIETWKQWIEAFDRAFETRDWTAARNFLTEDVVYVVAGAPFACELRGRDQVIEGFQKSLTNFDQKFTTRHWEPVDLHVWADQAVTCLAKGAYTLNGKPPITFAAKGSWFFRDDKICLMTDIYDLSEINSIKTLEWLATHGSNMNPSYT
ncbi:MAG: nuclear transport factor 2 family protein [Pseudomonadota bacterium]